jgi:hypothetical protein
MISSLRVSGCGLRSAGAVRDHASLSSWADSCARAIRANTYTAICRQFTRPTHDPPLRWLAQMRNRGLLGETPDLDQVENPTKRHSGYPRLTYRGE